jgi:hypothetical protein
MKDKETYLNRNGFPMLRRCKNCRYWNADTEFKNFKFGFCKAQTLFFAFTLEENCHPITKEFYTCEKHEFEDENRLKDVCEKVKLIDVIKKKDEIMNEKWNSI